PDFHEREMLSGSRYPAPKFSQGKYPLRTSAFTFKKYRLARPGSRYHLIGHLVASRPDGIGAIRPPAARGPRTAADPLPLGLERIAAGPKSMRADASILLREPAEVPFFGVDHP